MHDIQRTLRSVAADLWRVPMPEKQPESIPSAPDFTEVWKAVDDGVDWTELLAHPAANPQLAALANGVLQGDLTSYRAALDCIRPLSDLSAYYTDCAVEITTADALSVRYTAAFTAQDRRRACGLALRIARDLLAALPVSAVAVHAAHADGALLRAGFTRGQLRHIRVNIADPEAIASACGTWSEVSE